jgi:CPA2 family monovalent cation:H+ antiporter-2
MAYKELWITGGYNKGPLIVLEVLRNILGVVFIGFLVGAIFDTRIAILVLVPIATVILFLFSKKTQRFYQRIEGRFLQNLNSRETEATANDALGAGINEKNLEIQSELGPWSAYIIDLKVGQLANYVGKRLTELGWRETYGINIAYIKRGDKLIHAPGGEHVLLPFDQVGVITTEEQMQAFKPVFESTEDLGKVQPSLEDIVLDNIKVNEATKLKGISIRNSGIRELTNGLIVGIERNNRRILNPESTTIFEWNDVVWIVGDRKKIQILQAKGV